MLRVRLCSRQIRIAVAGALLCGAPPGVVYAQQTTTTRDTFQNVAISGDNPCLTPPEHFDGSGTQQNREEVTQNRFRFRTQTQGQATAPASGARYNVFDLTEQEMVTTAKNVTNEFEHREHFIREGKNRTAPQKNDDFFERVRTKTVTSNGVTTFKRDEMRTDCK